MCTPFLHTHCGIYISIAKRIINVNVYSVNTCSYLCVIPNTASTYEMYLLVSFNFSRQRVNTDKPTILLNFIRCVGVGDSGFF